MATNASLDFADCPEMLFIAACDGVLLRQTEMFARMFGPAVGNGTPLANAVHPEDQAAFAEAWSRFKQSAEPGRFECRIRDAQGVYRKVECRVRGLPESNAVYGSLRET